MAHTKIKLQKIREYDWRKLFFELIVVFLGVTAGFLLNSWHLQKQDQKLEQKYISGFLQDVKTNSDELEKSISSDSLWLNQVLPQIELVKAGTITVDSANAILIKIASISKIEFQTSTYEDITNSGKLNIINDFEMRKKIVDYHVALSGVNFIDGYFYSYFSDFVMPFIFSNFSVLDGQLANFEAIKTTQFSNVIAGYISMVQQRKAAYEDVLEKSITLTAELEGARSD